MLKNFSKTDKYILKWKDIDIGIVTYTYFGDSYAFEVINTDLPKHLYPPIWEIYPCDDITKPYLDWKLRDFLEEKVVPECRADIIMELLDIQAYHPWTILKKTRGVTTDDYWWLAEPGDKYEDFHIRAEWDKNPSPGGE